MIFLCLYGDYVYVYFEFLWMFSLNFCYYVLDGGYGFLLDFGFLYTSFP